MYIYWRKKEDFEMRPANALSYTIMTLNFHWPELYDNKSWIISDSNRFKQQIVQLQCENTFCTGLPDEGKLDPKCDWLLKHKLVKIDLRGLCTGTNRFPSGQLDLKYSLWA